MSQAPTEAPNETRGSLASYLTGFILAGLFTAGAFLLVIKGGALPKWAILAAIYCAAVAQILVHLHYFLHLDASRRERWNVLALIFTVLIAIIFVAGSLWVMSDLDYRMMM
jgi:cytochrome o ubiquinol oxidase operon protein cyoD